MTVNTPRFRGNRNLPKPMWWVGAFHLQLFWGGGASATTTGRTEHRAAIQPPSWPSLSAASSAGPDSVLPRPLHLQSQRSLWTNCQNKQQGWGKARASCSATVWRGTQSIQHTRVSSVPCPQEAAS